MAVLEAPRIVNDLALRSLLILMFTLMLKAACLAGAFDFVVLAIVGGGADLLLWQNWLTQGRTPPR